jgi:hypothetical protein
MLAPRLTRPDARSSQEQLRNSLDPSFRVGWWDLRINYCYGLLGMQLVINKSCDSQQGGGRMSPIARLSVLV